MALVTQRSDPSPEVGSMMHTQNLPLIAGQALLAFAPCHIESDGLVYMSNATAANADAQVHGFTVRAVASGQPVTLHGWGLRCSYAAAGTFTPGAKLYLGATDGRLDTAATTGDANGIAFCVTDTDIIFTRDF